VPLNTFDLRQYILEISFSFLLSKKPENYNWVFKDKNIRFEEKQKD